MSSSRKTAGPLSAEASLAENVQGHAHPMPLWQRSFYIVGSVCALISFAAFLALGVRLQAVVEQLGDQQQRVLSNQRELARVLQDLEARDIRQFCAATDDAVRDAVTNGASVDPLIFGARAAVGCPRLPGESTHDRP